MHWRALLVAALGLLAIDGSYGVPLPERWTEARAGWLFRSAQIPADDVEEVLRAEKIDLVIDLTDEVVSPERDAEVRASQKLGIRHLHLPVPPRRERAVQSYAEAVKAIASAHAQGQRVLVHCKVGYRRSASVIALYTRLVEQQPANVAYTELWRYSDGTSDWQKGYIRFLERNLDEIGAKAGAPAHA